MRFTVVATGQFSLRRAFGFRLTASSLTQLSVVNSPIRPAGLSPAWHPASPAHARTPKSGEHARPGRCGTRPRVPRCGRHGLECNHAPFRASRVFREGAENGARGGRAPLFYFGVRVCAGEAGCHAGESPAGRIGLFTTESCVREEAARRNPKARHRLNCPGATTVNLIE